MVEVVGPPGTVEVLDGFKRQYAADIDERQRVLGPEYLDARSGMGRARDVTVDGEDVVTVYERDGVVIEAFRVAHHAWDYAYGYRVEFDGAAVVLSGDTAYTPAIGRHARNADVLIHEAMSLDLMGMLGEALSVHDAGIRPDRLARIARAHTPTRDVARAAAEAGVPQLVLTHLIPPIPANTLAEGYFVRGMDEIYGGEIRVARDGMRLTLR